MLNYARWLMARLYFLAFSLSGPEPSITARLATRSHSTVPTGAQASRHDAIRSEVAIRGAQSVRPRILSNSADGARRDESRRYGFPELVDDIVYSHEVGLAKPDPAIFHLACMRLGVQPVEAVFIDDVAANVDGAAGAGLHAVQHESTQATISAVDALLTSQ